ncbi:MAG: cytochrome c-type biogenesis protein [Beijerinckiaceae bacterium]
MRKTFAALVLALTLAAPFAARAVQPDEVLPDPKLEQRARDLSTGLRCMVCQNQNIDDSDAPLARDLRLLVRERLKQGDSDAQVRDYLVQRYGDFVLLKPPFQMDTVILWATPAVVLVIAGLFVFLRSRAPKQAVAQGLSEEEKQALSRLKN